MLLAALFTVIPESGAGDGGNSNTTPWSGLLKVRRQIHYTIYRLEQKELEDAADREEEGGGGGGGGGAAPAGPSLSECLRLIERLAEFSRILQELSNPSAGGGPPVPATPAPEDSGPIKCGETCTAPEA